MTTFRVILSAIWFFSVLIYSIEGNELFTHLAFRWGVIASLALAFASGWLFLWFGSLIVPGKSRLTAATFWVVLFGSLLTILGSLGLHEIWKNSADPEYYKVNGVGPVHMVAYLAQAAGMVVGLRHLRSGTPR